MWIITKYMFQNAKTSKKIYCNQILIIYVLKFFNFFYAKMFLNILENISNNKFLKL